MRLMVAVFGLALSTTVLAQDFTLEQVFRAPFSSDLTAAPVGNTFAWVTNAEGRRNIWIDTVGQKAIQLTHYNEDDGQEISDLGFTADGSQLIYTRGGNVQGSEHPVPNPSHILPNAEQQIWSIATNGSGAPKLLATGHAPVVSPTKNEVAYIRSGQIFVTGLDTAAKTEHSHDRDDLIRPGQLFQLRGSQSNLRWSPDGNAIAFITDRGDHSFIAIYWLDEKRIVFADPGTSMDSEPAWSPDSRQVAFIRNATGYDDSIHRADHEGYPWQIRIADAHSGEGHMVWQADKGVGSMYRELAAKDNLIWTADNHIVFAWEKTGWLHLYSILTSNACHPERSAKHEVEGPAVAVCGARAAELTPGNFEVEHTAYDKQKNIVVYSSNQNDIDTRHIWTVSPAGNVQAFTTGKGIETHPAISANGTIAFIQSDAQQPVVPATKQGALAPELVPADFPASKLVTPQQVIFPATDGWQIHGQLFVPTNHRLEKSGQHPAVLFIHGGSRRQMYLGWNPMEYYSNTYAFNQYLCSLGYVVLSVNYRSGIGYGMEFRQAKDYGFLGASEYRDIVGAAKYLQTRKDVDATRIGSYGGSYGGYLTALALARNSDIFKAGVDYHGVHDWVLEMGFNRNSTDSTATRIEDRDKLAKLAWDSSPMASLDMWKSPVLLIQGDDDRNVIFTQTVRLAQALRDRGVHVEEKVFPDEVHDFLLRKNWLTTYHLSADFLNRELAK